MGKKSANKKSESTAANLGFEAKLSLIRGIEGNVGPVYASKREAANKTNLKGLRYGS